MSLKKIQRRTEIQDSEKLVKAYEKMDDLIEALGKKEIPSDQEGLINESIDLINYFEGTDRELIKMLKKTQSSILKSIEKELKYVAKHHYRTFWMAYGMMGGLIFSSVFSNSGMGIGSSGGVGLAVGMAIGMALGANMDSQAAKEGRQLEVSV
ncbi:MAG: hypothetical protein ACJA2S_003579 [Cyclobacteriaceae bacterium]|jgi:hypothetical protein